MKTYNAFYGEGTGLAVKCPICKSLKFRRKTIHLPNSFLQSFDLEALSEEGIMLICIKCGHADNFSIRSTIRTVESKE